MDNGSKCPQGVKNQSRVVSLERDMHEVKEAILEIRNKLIGRPTWTVTAIITILTSLTATSLGFALFIIKQVAK